MKGRSSVGRWSCLGSGNLCSEDGECEGEVGMKDTAGWAHESTGLEGLGCVVSPTA